MRNQSRILNSKFLILNFLFVAASLSAQSAVSVWSGVYTGEQARRGQAVANSKCQACHGERLAGDMGPPLAGTDFLSNWNGKPVSELFEKTQTTMPQGEEGTLTPAQTADLISYLFQLSKFPEGATELGTDLSALKQIQIKTTK